VAIAAFAAASLSGADPMRTGLAAVRFGWIAYVIPFMFVFSPSLLMEGSPLHISAAVLTAMGGVWLVSVGLVGFLTRFQSPLERVLYALSGIALVMPADAFPGALATDIAGLLLGAFLVARKLPLKKRSALIKPAPADS